VKKTQNKGYYGVQAQKMRTLAGKRKYVRENCKMCELLLKICAKIAPRKIAIFFVVCLG